MPKFIPREKLGKKARRALDGWQRRCIYLIAPATAAADRAGDPLLPHRRDGRGNVQGQENLR